MFDYLSIIIFLISSVYVMWNLMVHKITNHKVMVNGIMLLSLNICAATLWSPLNLSLIIICCLMKLCFLSFIITEYQSKKKISDILGILVNGKFVPDSYILKAGDVVESGDMLKFYHPQPLNKSSN